ncbi:hypothetical protein Y1Q_0019743 [Alligator mississippiensis]|uniref:Uncharacterized protein n=1 Tax=Alligator mississippiensis TaxID=8496 RepID=A0A151PFE4_ALLMI|nr:hypothetical protein Y1Q_0019743 [Alligator mississippiensis]
MELEMKSSLKFAGENRAWPSSPLNQWKARFDFSGPTSLLENHLRQVKQYCTHDEDSHRVWSPQRDKIHRSLWCLRREKPLLVQATLCLAWTTLARGIAPSHSAAVALRAITELKILSGV